MARNKARPGRTVTVFFIGLAICYGLVALIGTWKPALGLDLEGGTQIVLTAKGNVSKDNLNEAADIIDSRVNGSGVTEATVTTQGGNQIVVEVPGATQDNLVQIVERQAQLRFRLVAQVPAEHHARRRSPVASSTSPGAGVTKPAKPEGLVQANEPLARTARRRSWARTRPRRTRPRRRRRRRRPARAPSSSPTTAPGSGGNVPTSTSQVTYTPANQKAYQDALTWQTNPDPQSVARLQRLHLPAGEAGRWTTRRCRWSPVTPGRQQVPAVPGAHRGHRDRLRLRGRARLDPGPGATGRSTSSSTATVPTRSASSRRRWRATPSKHVRDRARRPGDLRRRTSSGRSPTARRRSAATSPRAAPRALATSLKYGALPITFDQSKTTTQVIGPSLAGDQLQAGITAGIVGLLLVMLYCLLYYRGLGLVVIASLLVAGATTYAHGAAARQERRLHADPARHRRTDRRGRHHRRLVHRLLRTHP